MKSQKYIQLIQKKLAQKGKDNKAYMGWIGEKREGNRLKHICVSNHIKCKWSNCPN